MEIHAASHLYPVASPSVEGGAIAIHDGRISAVGRRHELLAEFGGAVHDHPGAVIMPGLVNPHTHLELTHFPAWKIRKGIDYAPRTYVDWVIQVVKVRRALDHHELAASVGEGLRMCLEAGTTAIGEILTDHSLIPRYTASGLGGRFFFEVLGHDPARWEPLCSWIEGLQEEQAGLPWGISPHAPHTLSAELLTRLVGLARQRSVPLMIHLAESTEESEFFHSGGGRIAELLYPFAGWQGHLPGARRTTPTAWLEGLGALGPATSVVHAVHVTPADVEILRSRQVSVVLCPRSNDRLDVGRAPVHLLKRSGLCLALGTDSLASNDSLSLWDEMRFLLDEFRGEFTPAEALEMVTRGAATAIGCQGEMGTLEVGKRADFIVLDPGRTLAVERLAEGLLEGAKVSRVYRSGRPLA
jgi:cytosine/adenosine deaminase-related metal-dependent hydrolase